MPAALFAVRLTAISTSGSVDADCICIVVGGIDWTGSDVFIDDGLHEGTGAHRADLKKANLFASQSHLRDGIVDHHAEFGMETNLKRIDAHKY